jgi:mannose-6-phosphate isomerase-like protein (cupin superfamily)
MQPLFVPDGGGERIRLAALGIEQRVLVPAAAGAGLVIIEETTAPGKGPPLHIHHGQSECFRFLKGEYELLVEDRLYRATPGAAAMVPAGVRHTFRNIGTTPGRFMFTLSPALEGEAFFTELAALTLSGEPDPTALAALARRHGTEFVGPPLGAG